LKITAEQLSNLKLKTGIEQRNSPKIYFLFVGSNSYSKRSLGYYCIRSWQCISTVKPFCDSQHFAPEPGRTRLSTKAGKLYPATVLALSAVKSSFQQFQKRAKDLQKFVHAAPTCGAKHFPLFLREHVIIHDNF